MKFALALVAGITQATQLKTNDWNVTVSDDGSWNMDTTEDDWYTEEDDWYAEEDDYYTEESCSYEWFWEDFT